MKNQKKKVPFFAKFLENQVEETGEVKGGKLTNPKKDVYTMKYPSDTDEVTTMKYPSDSDEI